MLRWKEINRLLIIRSRLIGPLITPRRDKPLLNNSTDLLQECKLLCKELLLQGSHNLHLFPILTNPNTVNNLLESLVTSPSTVKHLLQPLVKIIITMLNVNVNKKS